MNSRESNTFAKRITALVMRNIGARHAVGEIIAYTDADCVADEDWLRCLVQACPDQGVSGIGGPNITPHSDGKRALHGG